MWVVAAHDRGDARRDAGGMNRPPDLQQVHEMTPEQRLRMAQDFNAAVVAEFRANAGRVGGAYPFSGRPMVLLHHRGSRSGVDRVTPLGCFPEPDGSRLVAATYGGLPRHPAWFHNLIARPRTTIEVPAGTSVATVTVDAEVLGGAERDAAWERMAACARSFREYERLTTRIIPVVRLVEVR
jgi:deazaflavin-dependent oxidoreductase (nitroreductase family)